MRLIVLQYYVLGFQSCSLVAQITTHNTLWAIGSVGLGFIVVAIGWFIKKLDEVK